MSLRLDLPARALALEAAWKAGSGQVGLGVRLRREGPPEYRLVGRWEW